MEIHIGGGFWTSMLSGAVGVVVGAVVFSPVTAPPRLESTPEYKVETKSAVMTWTFKNKRPPESQESEWEKQTILDFFNVLSFSARATSYPEINKVMHLRIQFANLGAMRDNLILWEAYEMLPDSVKNSMKDSIPADTL